MNKTLKYLLIAVGLIVLIGAFSLFSFYNTPQASVKEKAVDLTLSATELFEEYSENQTVADKKFIDQIIQINGQIAEIFEDQKGATVLLLNTGNNESGVLCTLELTESGKVKGKKVGEEITLKGVCTGMLMEVVLNKGIVVDK